MNEFYIVDGQTYEVAPNRKEEFLSKFPNAVLKQEEVKTTGVDMGATAPLGQAPGMALPLESGLSESQEDKTGETDTWLEDTFGKNFLTDYVGDIYRGIKAGYRQSTSVDEAFDLMSKGSSASQEEIEEFIKATQYSQGAEVSDEMKEFQKIYEEEGGGAFGFLKGMLKTRFQVVPQVMASSMATMFGSAVNAGEVLAAGAAGAGAGAGAGAAIGGLGAIPGAVAGLMTGVSGAMESGLTFAELLQDELAKEGKEFTKENIKELLSDEEKFRSLKNRSIGRGATIGAIEGIGTALTGGAVKALKPVTALGRVGKTAAAFGGEGLAGGVGEAAGRAVAGQEMDAAEIGLEAVGGMTGAPLAFIKSATKKPQYRLNGEEVTRAQMEEFINSDDGSNISKANVQIKDDSDLVQQGSEKRTKYLIKEGAKERITNEEDLNAYVEAEYQKGKLESKKNKSSIDKQDLKNVNTQLSNIYEKYSTTEQETKEGVVGVLKKEAEQQVGKGVELAKAVSGVLGISDVNEIATPDEFYKALADNSSKEEAAKIWDYENNKPLISGVGGAFVNGKILINTKESAGSLNINVGAHEILHPILNSQIGDAVAQESMVKKFRSTLTRAERRDMDAIMAKRNYSVQQGNYYTEYLNVYSDAIAKNELSMDKTTIEKIKDFIKKFFKQYDINVGFENAQQIKNFIKEFSKSAKTGKPSQAVLDAIDVAKVKERGITLGAETQRSQQALNDKVDALVGPKDPSGNYTVTKQQYMSDGFGMAYMSIIEGNMLDGLIRRGIEGSSVYGKPIENFVEDVKMGLVGTLERFNPEDNNSLIGWINKQLRFRKQEVMDRYREEGGTTSIDIEAGETGSVREISEEAAFDEFDTFDALPEEDTMRTDDLIDPRKMLDAPVKLDPESDTVKALKMTEQEVKAYNEFNLEEAIDDVDLASTTLANTPRLFDYLTAVSMGINPKKVFSTKITLTSSELKSSQDFIYNNIDKIIALLPEGSTDKATGKAFDEFLNRGMNLPNNILRAFYTRQERLAGDPAGLYPFKLNKNISNAEALAAFGIDSQGNKIQGVTPRSPEAQTIKALATVLSKLATNTHLRELVNKTDSDPALLLNLSEGKSPAQLSLNSMDPETVLAESKSFTDKFNNLSVSDKALFEEKFEDSLEKMLEDSVISSKNYGSQVFAIEKVEEFLDVAEKLVAFLPNKIFAKNKGLVKSIAGLHYRVVGYTESYDRTIEESLDVFLNPDSKKSFSIKGKIVLQAKDAKETKALQQRKQRISKVLQRMKNMNSFVTQEKRLPKNLSEKVNAFVKKYHKKGANGKTIVANLEPFGTGFIANANNFVNEPKKLNDFLSRRFQNNEKSKDLFEITITALHEFYKKNNDPKTGRYLINMIKSSSNVVDGFRALTMLDRSYDELIVPGDRLQIEHLDGNVHTTFERVLMQGIMNGVENVRVPRIAVMSKSISNEMNAEIGAAATGQERVEWIRKKLRDSKGDGKAQFSFDTAIKTSWVDQSQELNEALDIESAIQMRTSFKIGDIEYGISISNEENPFTYEFEKIEERLELGRGNIADDESIAELAFSKKVFNEELGFTRPVTSITGDASEGRLNQFTVFATVANAAIEAVKAKKMNGIYFTSNEQSRSELYYKLSNFFAKKLGWNATSRYYTDEATLHFIYNPDVVLRNSTLTEEQKNSWQIKGYNAQFSQTDASVLETRMAGILSNKDSRYTVAQVIDAATAKNLAAKRRKRRDIIAPSADDFAGLLYRFLDKGKMGEEQFKFFEDKLIKPFARAYNQLNVLRQRVGNNYKQVKKNNPEAVKMLKKDSGYAGFTFEQALRVWMFNKIGQIPNGLNEETRDRLIEIVKKNPILEKFGYEVSNAINLDTFYVEPDPKNWQLESIQSDVVKATEKVSRKALLDEWINNKDEIFSKNNMNKIEATYGKDFVDALNDMLYRMENGTARPEGMNKQANEFLNWVRGSVAVTMFFNTRSAILQQLSNVNFLNWGDNNPIKAAAAFANINQYAKDWAFIFNSPYLKERRGGLKTDVNAAELAEAIKKGGIKGLHAKLLQLGFSLTQIGDSMAIATGGATFLRNRINTYVKQGLPLAAAEQKAFLDFQEISEETQQSARPDRLAKQQTDVIGRVFLAFQNTPMQYTRIIVKAAKDLAAGRGDAKTNITKIVHYMVLQNIIFSAMQQALFAMLFDDEEDEKEAEKNQKKIERIINNSVDTIIRGTGLYGAVLTTAKNVALKFAEQEAKQAEGKGRADHAYTMIEALNISPPVGIKARQMYGSIQNYRYNKDVIDDMGLSISNPVLDVAGSASAFAFNVPLDRAISKLRNLKAASDAETETWARIALALGWNTWNVGIENEELKQVKADAKKERAQQRKQNKTSGSSKFTVGKPGSKPKFNL